MLVGGIEKVVNNGCLLQGSLTRGFSGIVGLPTVI